jgi:hypothetical protein
MDRPGESVNEFANLNEQEIIEKLDGLSEKDKIAALFNHSCSTLSHDWVEKIDPIIYRAKAFRDDVTPEGRPDVLTLLAASFSYLNMLEKAAEDMAREDLATQCENNQMMIKQLDLFTTKILDIQQDVLKLSDHLEAWMSFRIIRRELRLNITEDGKFAELSEFEEEKVEPARIIENNKEETNE